MGCPCAPFGVTIMTILRSLIVGSHFAPPAKALLEHLPSGAALRVQLENDNPYDEHAILVHVRPEAVPESQWAELEVKLPGMGLDWEELRGLNDWLVLGHVASSDGKPLAKAKVTDAGLVGTREFREAIAIEGEGIPARLEFGGGGEALVVIGATQ